MKVVMNLANYVDVNDLAVGDVFMVLDQTDTAYMLVDKADNKHRRVVNLTTGRITYPTSFRNLNLMRVSAKLECFKYVDA